MSETNNATQAEQQAETEQQQQQVGSQGKLFVGQVPAVCTEDMLRPVFQPYGEIIEIKIMRDAPGGRSKGCAWVKYASRDQAQAAIESLHEQHTIPPQTNTLQVRFADDKARTGGSATAFIGNLPSNTSPEDLKDYIVSILPNPAALKDVNVPAGKLFGFITFDSAQDCSTAVAHVQGQAPMFQGNVLRVQAARPRTAPGANNMAAAMAAYYASFTRGGGGGGGPMMDPATAAFLMASRGGGGGGGFGGGGGMMPQYYAHYGGQMGGPPNPYSEAAAAATGGKHGGYGAPPGYQYGGGGGGRGGGPRHRGGGGGGYQRQQYHGQGQQSWNGGGAGGAPPAAPGAPAQQ